MIARRHRLASQLVLALILVLGQAVAVSAASPTPAPSTGQQRPPDGATLTAEPALVTAEVAPGGKGTVSLTLHAGVALDITIEPQGLGQSAEDGGFSFVPADKDTSPYSVRSALSVDPASFRMNAGDARQVKITIALPGDAKDGERFGLLKVNGQPLPGSGNVGIGVALGVAVLVTIPGATETRSGSIGDLAVGSVTAGQTIAVTGTVANTGNTHYGAPPSQVYQKATLKNQAGDTLATTSGTFTGNSIVPTFKRAFQLSLAPGAPLGPGKYTVDVEVGLKDGPVLDTKTVSLDGPGGAVLGTTQPGTGSSQDLLLLLLAAGLGVAGVVIVFLILRRPAAQRGSAS